MSLIKPSWARDVKVSCPALCPTLAASFGLSERSHFRTGVPCPYENAYAPRTTLESSAWAYGKVLGGCVFL